ncbi:hypothetical protein Q2T40_15030 [Winogradskyella maritima]|uniref:Uncharacterized protein n=1 Tax=Winogradskyella maritima TaxID=1517766 RepID=A0ABV8AIW4_9FLAO|nr:hypothetical protein [Winogradskyella maritima]
MEPERGTSGPSKDKVIQLVENNGMLMLAVAACEKCFPALYTYKSDLSKQFGKSVFNNSMGFYAVSYDGNSFVVFLPSLSAEKDFEFSNFYSKETSKLKFLTKKKVEEYATKLLDLL